MTIQSDRTQPAGKETWTVRDVLQWTGRYLAEHGSGSPRLDAELLLSHVRNCRRIELYTGYDEPLTTQQRTSMRELVRRRALTEPVAYLVGHREFFGLDFRVTPDVLIPRPETETLVSAVIDIIRSGDVCRVLEIGTGSGCVAVALATNCRESSITATDNSPAALEVAKRNATRHAVADRIEFVAGDCFSGVDHKKRFDLLVSNPPYVAESEIDSLPPDVRLHEPHSALFAGRTGLDFLARLIDESPRHLHSGTHVLLECDPRQVAALKRMIEHADQYDEARVYHDLSRSARVIATRIRTPEG